MIVRWTMRIGIWNDDDDDDDDDTSQMRSLSFDEYNGIWIGGNKEIIMWDWMSIVNSGMLVMVPRLHVGHACMYEQTKSVLLMRRK